MFRLPWLFIPRQQAEDITMHTALIFRERLLAPSETFIVEQAKTLRHFSPVLIGLRQTQPSLRHPFPEVLLCKGCGLIDKVAAALYRWLPFAPNYYRKLSALDPSIIHAHFAVDAMQALPIARKLNLPLIVSLHGFDVTASPRALCTTHSGRHYIRHRNRLFREATAFICVSEFIRKKAIEVGFPESKLHVHYTGVDCQRFRPTDIARDPKLVLFVGRLVEVKGCDYLLRAMFLAQQFDPGVHLEIIGDGPLRAKLETLAAELDIHVQFRGVQDLDEVKRTMSRARILCNPSVTASSGDMEGFGMVFAEAQAVGTPVVSFAHGAIPEAVDHGHTGLLVPEGDIKALAHSLEILLSNDELWRSMSMQARQWVLKHFDISNQADRLEALYNNCILQHHHARTQSVAARNLNTHSSALLGHNTRNRE
jgi:colanic acid/amylovoran biosynthesis glycosyltransferase